MQKFIKQFIVPIILSFVVLYCNTNSKEQQKEKYSYEDVVKIFALSQYVSNFRRIQSYILPRFNLNEVSNQNRYELSILDYIKTEKEWNTFIKKTIDYYISFRKKNKPIVSYYEEYAYNEKLGFFDNNYLIDLKNKKLPPSYWKIEETEGKFIKKKQIYKKLLFSKEYNVSSKPKERFYYDEAKHILKKETFKYNPKSMRVFYYYNNKEIID